MHTIKRQLTVEQQMINALLALARHADVQSSAYNNVKQLYETRLFLPRVSPPQVDNSLLTRSIAIANSLPTMERRELLDYIEKSDDEDLRLIIANYTS